MDRVFLDANVLFSAAYRPNPGLLQLWRIRGILLCTSRYALAEARVNLEEETQRARLVELSKRLELFEAIDQKLPTGVSLPEKDVPIMLAAISARATHLLTGDLRHFGPYIGKKIAEILILLPVDYLKTHRQK